MFTGFEAHRVRTNGVEINLALGGTGPALLLLHGHPQTYVIWHKVANQLATRFTVVATDLRGYGDSSKPAGLPDHSDYSKRVMAQDQVEVMRQLGFENFFLVRHDRGGRVARRASSGVQYRRRGRASDSARNRHRWGSNRVAGLDPLHDARALPLVRTRGASAAPVGRSGEWANPWESCEPEMS